MMRLPLMFALLVALLSPVTQAADARPNIILILSDDHTWSRYGFMGSTQVQTPNLDRMAGEGLLYTRGYSMPVCSPSLACLLTGLLPSKHGITGNDLHADTREAQKKVGSNRDPLRERLLSNPVILPKALSDAGYLTFQTGKLWNTAFSEVGFTHGMTKERSRHGGAGLSIGREGMQPVHDFIDMATAQGKPFFIWYAPMMPHDPHNPPARLQEKYTGKGPTKHGETYHAMIEWFDETCGDLDRYLDEKGLKQNTMIVYLSDNGWDPENGYQGGRAKLTPYENGIRTPIFVRWPGKVEPARDESSLASIIDIAPTILQAAGVETKDLPGLKLTDRKSVSARPSILIESYRHDIMDLDDPAKSLISQVVIDGWSKLILPGPVKQDGSKAKFAATAGVVELFDLKTDPLETKNLAAERPQEVTRLKSIQDAFWKID